MPREVSGNEYTTQKLLFTNGEVLKYLLRRSCNGTYTNCVKSRYICFSWITHWKFCENYIKPSASILTHFRWFKNDFPWFPLISVDFCDFSWFSWFLLISVLEISFFPLEYTWKFLLEKHFSRNSLQNPEHFITLNGFSVILRFAIEMVALNVITFSQNIWWNHVFDDLI